MSQQRMVQPGAWDEISGVWVYVAPLDDPLLSQASYRVTVHPDPLTVHVEGNCAGVTVQTHAPDTRDFARTDGEPL